MTIDLKLALKIIVMNLAQGFQQLTVVSGNNLLCSHKPTVHSKHSTCLYKCDMDSMDFTLEEKNKMLLEFGITKVLAYKYYFCMFKHNLKYLLKTNGVLISEK